MAEHGESDSPLMFVIVVFDLPFAVLVPDSMEPGSAPAGFENYIVGLEVDRRCQKADGKPKSITGLLKAELKSLAGIAPIEDTCPFRREVDRWDRDARELRNAIAHGKKTVVTRDETEKCTLAVRDLLRKLEKVLPDVHPAGP